MTQVNFTNNTSVSVCIRSVIVIFTWQSLSPLFVPYHPQIWLKSVLTVNLLLKLEDASCPFLSLDVAQLDIDYYVIYVSQNCQMYDVGYL